MSVATIEDTVRSPVDEESPVEEKSIPCEYYGEYCENDAEFIFIRTCCGRKIFFCEDCMYKVLGFLKKELGKIQCLNCETWLTAPDYLKYLGRL